MNRAALLADELRYLRNATVVCTLLPLPLLFFVHSPIGRGYALMLFFVGAMAVVAYSFRRDLVAYSVAELDPSQARKLWKQRIASLVVALSVALLAFTLVSVLVNNPYNYGTAQGLADEGIWWRAFIFEIPRDFAAPILAALAVAAAICIVPYWVLATRKPYAAVVFSAALIGSMKLVGCLIVVLIYGWDSDQQGRLGMPWNDPDLLVWLFFGFSTMLSVTCLVIARRRFVQQYCGSEVSVAHRPPKPTNPLTLGA